MDKLCEYSNESYPDSCDHYQKQNQVQTWTYPSDCSCGCPSSPPPTCQFPQIYDPTQCKCVFPVFSRTENSCDLPKIWRNDLCQCSCSIGSIGGPCVQNGQFISDGIVLDDCTCGIQCSRIQILDTAIDQCKCPEFMVVAQIINVYIHKYGMTNYVHVHVILVLLDHVLK